MRDNLADCLSTLPTLIERDAQPSLHFYFANFEGMRKKLFPLASSAYQAWVETGDLAPLKDAVARGCEHWRATGNKMIAAQRTGEAEMRLVEIGESTIL